MEEQLVATLSGMHPEAESVEVRDFAPIAGGFSRETFRFDAVIQSGGAEEILPLILRKDPPKAVQILETSREIEHLLIEAVRTRTNVPVSRSLCHQMDPSVFGECAMIIERASGNGQTSDLFNDGPDADQAEDVIAHLCEVLVELHETDISKLNEDGALDDPRGVGIDTSSWDAYMDSTFEYYINAYDDIAWDPSMMVLLDSFLTLRRNKPRPGPLALVHGDFNPANFLYEDNKVTALIDWENSRVGDPREDLGWMMLMDVLSNSKVMEHPRSKGGFLAYYNELRGMDITPEELGYFTMFGTANIAVPVNHALKLRVTGEQDEFLHMYLIQASAPALPSLCHLMSYPGVSL